MSKPLYLATLKANWIIGLFVTLMILIYVTTSISMFNPESFEAFAAMLELLPEGLLRAFGFDNLGTDLTAYLGGYLYGFIFIVFPLVYTVIVANKLIAKHVDSGSMAYLLTTPNTRMRVAATQAVYLLTSTAVIFLFNIAMSILMSEALFKGLLDIPKFLAINWITFLVVAAVGGIGFFFSCLFSDVKHSLAFGGGIPIVFFLIKMLSEISTDLEWLRYFTIYSFVNSDEILASNAYTVLSSVILLMVGGALYSAAIVVFNRKSLAI